MSQAPSVGSEPPVTATDSETNAVDSSAATLSPIEQIEAESRAYFSEHPDSAIEHLGQGDESAILKALTEGEAIAPSDGPAVAEDQTLEDVLPEEQQAPKSETDDQAPEADDDPAPEAEGDAPAKTPQYRLRPRSELDAEALKLMKSNPQMEGSSAYDLARERLGIDQPDSPAPAADETPPEPSRSMADIKSEMAEARSKVIEGADALDDDVRDAALEKIDSLTDELTSMVEGDAVADAFDASQAKVIEAYGTDGALPPEVLDRIQEIDRAWVDLGDERANQANKPELLMNIVAAEQNLAPRSASANSSDKTTQATPPQTDSVPAGKRQAASEPPLHPASGNARTSSGGPTDIDAELALVNTPEELAAFNKRHGLGDGMM